MPTMLGSPSVEELLHLRGNCLGSKWPPLTRLLDKPPSSLSYMLFCPPGIAWRRLIETFPQLVRSEDAQARQTWHAISSGVPTSIRGACYSTIRVPLDLQVLYLR